MQVQPKKGTALLWSNIDVCSNDYNMKTIHRADPLTTDFIDMGGSKYGLNIFIWGSSSEVYEPIREFFTQKPTVTMINDFLPDTIVDAILELVQTYPVLMESSVQGSDESHAYRRSVSAGLRRSLTAGLREDMLHGMSPSLSHKIMLQHTIRELDKIVLSTFQLKKNHPVEYQVVHYADDVDHFDLHHDSVGIVQRENTWVADEEGKPSHWRVVSIFAYLNTVPPNGGGCTVFPFV